MRLFLKHALLWTGLFIVYTYMMSFYGDYRIKILHNLVNVPLFMIAYYLLKHVQIPYLYNRGRMVLMVLTILMMGALFAAICRTVGILWTDSFYPDSEDPPFMTIGSFLFKTVQYYTPAMAILAWQSHHERRDEVERMQELEKEKLATELKFLKAQLNPHFLFNTLNNLYSYVLNQSPKAPDMVLRLSAILDYVLYKSQNKTVPLGEEVHSIQNFIGLEKIRYGERLQVDCCMEGDMSQPISPLILLSLTENAFKHGASGDLDSPYIKIAIRENNGSIHCAVKNSKSKLKGELNDAYKEGIGLSNIKRQLNLIYPDRYELDIQDEEETFNVSLTMRPLA